MASLEHVLSSKNRRKMLKNYLRLFHVNKRNTCIAFRTPTFIWQDTRVKKILPSNRTVSNKLYEKYEMYLQNRKTIRLPDVIAGMFHLFWYELRKLLEILLCNAHSPFSLYAFQWEKGFLARTKINSRSPILYTF